MRSLPLYFFARVAGPVWITICADFFLLRTDLCASHATRANSLNPSPNYLVVYAPSAAVFLACVAPSLWDPNYYEPFLMQTACALHTQRELTTQTYPLPPAQTCELEPLVITNARVLLRLGDNVTTDIISPAGM